MDLTAAGVSSYQQAQTMGQVQVSVAKKALDVQRMEGAAAIQLIQAASRGGSGPGDPLTAAASGLGGQIDVAG